MDSVTRKRISGNPVSKLLLVLSASLIFVLVVVIQSCNTESSGPETQGPTPYEFPEMKYFPTQLNIPADNPMTIEGVELGRYLFYDGRMSGRTHPDSLMSCASCHIQANGFEIGMDHPKHPGGHPRGLPTEGYLEGKPTPHTMLPTVNLVFNANGYGWNGFLEESNELTSLPGYDFTGVDNLNFKNVEAFTYMAIVAKHEMDGNILKTVNLISSDPMYPPLFAKAFGTEEITAEKISKSISQFIRSIVSYRSKFHKSLRGEAELTALEQYGHELFFSEEADCFHCHGGSVLMTNNLYFNNAKDTEFTDDRDRFSITGSPADIGAYRAPSLLNVALNGPYMHDGRFATLDEVIDFYSEGLVYSEHVHPLMKNVNQGGVHLDDEEKAALKAFLLTLTDHELLTDPQYGPPAELGQWAVQ